LVVYGVRTGTINFANEKLGVLKAAKIGLNGKLIEKSLL
jgi:hypothetical protein